MTDDATSTATLPAAIFEIIACAWLLLCTWIVLIVLDEKLVPLEGEDESRIVKLLERSKDPKTGLIDPQSIPRRMWRSFERRWHRACNYSVKNFVRAMTGKRIDGCPRLTRARRLVARSTPRARKKASAQKRAWRQDPSVKRRENTSIKVARCQSRQRQGAAGRVAT
jgi:hypothetical protein